MAATQPAECLHMCQMATAVFSLEAAAAAAAAALATKNSEQRSASGSGKETGRKKK